MGRGLRSGATGYTGEGFGVKCGFDHGEVYEEDAICACRARLLGVSAAVLGTEDLKASLE